MLLNITDGHFVMSPLSLWNILATLAEGATGETYNQLHKGLAFNNRQEQQYQHYTVFNDLIQVSGEVMGRAGLLAIDDLYDVKPSFTDLVNRMGTLTVKKVPMTNNVRRSVDIINQHMNEATKGHTTDPVNRQFVRNKDLLLLDALWFEGEQKTKFTISAHESDNIQYFYNEHGTYVGNVFMIEVTANNFTAYQDHEMKALVIELSFKHNEKNTFNILLYLPHPKIGLTQFMKDFHKSHFSAHVARLGSNPNFSGKIKLPKLNITQNHGRLREALMDMGIVDMFDEDKASFGNIVDEDPYTKFYVNNIHHEARIDFIPSRAYFSSHRRQLTSTMTPMPFPREIVFNRPFYFAIIERRRGIPIVTGAYSKPSVYF